jgi:DNA mismatch repair protein MutL
VEQLFYNVPARRKFLRSARSEWRAITEALNSVALSRPDVRFSLSHDGKEVLSLPPVSSLRARVSGIWGGKYAGGLLDVDDVAGVMQVSGLVERPADVGTTTRRVFVAVNGRAIRDNGIVRAAEAAYRSTISAGLRPSLFLEVRLPAAAVDVNVHPAKAEVRFRDRWPVERAVEAAVRRALGTFDSSAMVGGSYFVSANRSGADFGGSSIEGVSILTPSAVDREPLFAGAGQDEFDQPQTPVASRQEIPPLFQFKRTYIAFEHADGLVLIDQHSAHERVLYEEFMKALETGRAPHSVYFFQSRFISGLPKAMRSRQIATTSRSWDLR